MKPIIRSILTPLAVIAAAAVLAWLFIQREERSARQEMASGRTTTPENNLALRIAAIESAKKDYAIMLATEKIDFEREKKEGNFPELAELTHEVRMLRIDLEHRTALAAIDKKYPPPSPAPAAPPAP